MYSVRVTRPRYEQSRAYAGQVGEVVGHWGPETNEHGRDGYLVQFPDGNVVGIAEDEVETVTTETTATPAISLSGIRQRPTDA